MHDTRARGRPRRGRRADRVCQRHGGRLVPEEAQHDERHGLQFHLSPMRAHARSHGLQPGPAQAARQPVERGTAQHWRGFEPLRTRADLQMGGSFAARCTLRNPIRAPDSAPLHAHWHTRGLLDGFDARDLPAHVPRVQARHEAWGPTNHLELQERGLAACTLPSAPWRAAPPAACRLLPLVWGHRVCVDSPAAAHLARPALAQLREHRPRQLRLLGRHVDEVRAQRGRAMCVRALYAEVHPPARGAGRRDLKRRLSAAAPPGGLPQQARLDGVRKDRSTAGETVSKTGAPASAG